VYDRVSTVSRSLEERPSFPARGADMAATPNQDRVGALSTMPSGCRRRHGLADGDAAPRQFCNARYKPCRSISAYLKDFPKRLQLGEHQMGAGSPITETTVFAAPRFLAGSRGMANCFLSHPWLGRAGSGTWLSAMRGHEA
jgi:hypothetical protein